ncbi:MAG: hypothetical protein AB1726_17990 [Planctomycetota bacterium]
MDPRDVFGIIVRTIGLLLLLSWAPLLVLSVFARDGRGVLVSFVVWALGAYLLRGAPYLLAFAYPGQSPDRSRSLPSGDPAQSDRPSSPT